MSISRILTEEFLRFSNAEYIRKFMDAKKKLDLSRTKRLKDMTMPEPSVLYKFFEDEARIPSMNPFTKDAIVTVTPREFLGASAKGAVHTRTLDYFLNKIEETGKLDMPDVPMWMVKEENDRYRITGHEGRHRSLIFILMGFSDQPMPVRLTSWHIRFKKTFEDNQIELHPQLGSPHASTLELELMYRD